MDSFSKEDYIVLKVDIEGAEYEVLEKMFEDGSIEYIDELYIEWHYDKVKIPRERHVKISRKLQALKSLKVLPEMNKVLK
jgi:hypothetical protein